MGCLLKTLGAAPARSRNRMPAVHATVAQPLGKPGGFLLMGDWGGVGWRAWEWRNALIAKAK